MLEIDFTWSNFRLIFYFYASFPVGFSLFLHTCYAEWNVDEYQCLKILSWISNIPKFGEAFETSPRHF